MGQPDWTDVFQVAPTEFSAPVKSHDRVYLDRVFPDRVCIDRVYLHPQYLVMSTAVNTIFTDKQLLEV